MARTKPAAAPVGAPVLTQSFSIPAPNPQAEDAPQDERLSFWEHLYAIADTDWWSGRVREKGWKVYLYEDTPSSPYIAKITHPFDIEWVKQEFGGGSYWATLNDPSGRMAVRADFTIDGEPKRKPPQSAAASPISPPGDAPSPFETQVLRVMEENNRQMREMFLQALNHRERESPAAPSLESSAVKMQMDILPAVVGGIVKMFEGMIPKQTDSLDLLVKLQTLMPKQPDLLGLLKDAKAAGLIPDATPGGNLLEQLSTISAIAEKLGWTNGGGGKSIGEVLIDKGPDILRAMSDGIKEFRGLEEKRLETAQTLAVLQQQQPVAAAPGTVPPGVPQPHPQAGYANGLPAPAAAGQPMATPLSVEPFGDAQQPGATGQLAAEITAERVDSIKAQVAQAILQGATGDDIIGFLNVTEPTLLGGFVGVPEEQLALFFSNDPIMRVAVQSPTFRATIKEIVEILNEESQEGPDQKIH